ncbi:MAG: Undecaprenyl diphosphate synthase (EC [uncultured Thiotrichaceae bacterium]|uniref:Ditrans,polycis-undecaprenyl-diphosphate synthase ((2E,6E)-farnesyl-diphosphate specific) n=1 Tax=uncultured Thiotrichaceae bacterium TaxID=298394 RepID=A0A6S6SS82_9GAMM|nr:MAG: Undecaprenyl diphosphate synthase (EC [uncultured Thiotrichaceae bacterium]
MSTEKNKIPRHVAIVMDGNGRWAKKRHFPRTYGHKKGVDSVRAVIRACDEIGIEYLTLFAFSSENWKRPEDEVSALMSLFMSALEAEAKSLAKNGIRLSFIGDISAFPDKLQAKIAQVEKLTVDGKNLHMQIAANYGGRWDIAQAAAKLSQELQQSGQDISVDSFSEAKLSEHLTTTKLNIPDPDLFIRTGGEQRISNFLLWQIAYAELYFTDVLWPDFRRDELFAAVEDYSRRQRRFGMTGDQVEEKNA